MHEKERLDREQATCGSALQRREPAACMPAGVDLAPGAIHERLRSLRNEVDALDQRIVPLARESGQLGHPHLGPVDARRQRQEPPRAPDRTPRRRLHLARVEPSST
jgi:hypothetical protein